MAPRMTADSCLFCAPDPCTCNTKKKAPARAPRKQTQEATPPPKVEPPKPAEPFSVVEKSAAPRPRTGGLRAVKSLAPKIQRPTVVQAVRQQEDQREDELSAAIRLFAESGLVEEDELIRHRTELRMTDHDFRELLLKVRGT